MAIENNCYKREQSINVDSCKEANGNYENGIWWVYIK